MCRRVLSYRPVLADFMFFAMRMTWDKRKREADTNKSFASLIEEQSSSGDRSFRYSNILTPNPVLLPSPVKQLGQRGNWGEFVCATCFTALHRSVYIEQFRHIVGFPYKEADPSSDSPQTRAAQRIAVHLALLCCRWQLIYSRTCPKGYGPIPGTILYAVFNCIHSLIHTHHSF